MNVHAMQSRGSELPVFSRKTLKSGFGARNHMSETELYKLSEGLQVIFFHFGFGFLIFLFKIFIHFLCQFFLLVHEEKCLRNLFTIFPFYLQQETVTTLQQLE